MAEITKSVDESLKATIITVDGPFEHPTIMAVVREFYEAGPTLNLVFDLTKADLSELTSREMTEIIDDAKKGAHLRRGGKTALIMGTDLGFGIARMYETYTDIHDHPADHQTFRTKEEALKWLTVE